MANVIRMKCAFKKLINYFFILSTTVILFSCKKEATVPSNSFSETSYKVRLQLNWKNPEFVVPPNAHITVVVGMVHAPDISLWNVGTLATKGIEDVAEVGALENIFKELDDVVGKSKALNKFIILPPAVTTFGETYLNFNTNYPSVSFLSMIAPTPDWFLGIHDLNLRKNNQWIADTTLNLALYDAGTEDGDVLGSNNPATVPQQNIQLLTPLNASALANGNATIAPIGTVRFTKN